MKTFKEIFQPPFYYDEAGTMIFDQNGIALDVRAWGRLTGTGALNLPTDQAMKIQDDFGKYVAELLNENWNKK